MNTHIWSENIEQPYTVFQNSWKRKNCQISGEVAATIINCWINSMFKYVLPHSAIVLKGCNFIAHPGSHTILR